MRVRFLSLSLSFVLLAGCGSSSDAGTGQTAASTGTGGTTSAGGSSSTAAGTGGVAGHSVISEGGATTTGGTGDAGGAIGVAGMAATAGMTGASGMGGAGGASSSCASDADCAGDTKCAFSPALVCGFNVAMCTTGTCRTPLPPSGCGAITLVQACGCDGTTVSWHGGCGAEFPDGYGPVPYRSIGACPAAGVPCVDDSDCDGGGVHCLYPAGAGCSAQGQCVSDGSCNCGNVCCSGNQGCACDGTTVHVDCKGFAQKPLMASGACP